MSTVGMVGGATLSDQDVSPATAVISDLLQALLASDPAVDLDAMEAALLAELDAGEPQLSVLADAASALFNAMRDANLDTTPFAVALEDLLVDGEVNSAALAATAPTVQEAVAAAEEARGTQVAAAFAARIPAQRIRHVQGAAHRSPREGQMVSVPGIVTALASGGLYLQDPAPDSSAATSEGIFVFTSATPTVAVGDAVMVRGVVAEFRPGGSGGTDNLTTTELTTPSITVLSSGNPLPTATVIGSGGRIPPQAIIADDVDGDAEQTGTFDAATDGLDFYESLEGMLVQVNDAVAVSPTNAFGEIAVVSNNGANAGLRTPRGGIVIQPDDFNPERIILDDALVSDVPEVNVGDRFAAPVLGVLDYSFGNFKLLNTTPLPAVTPGDLVEEVTTLTGSPNQLTVATFNVENLDNNPNDDDTANEDTARLARLAAIIVDHLGAPDIIALQEVQDNSGSIDNGAVDASRTYEALITAIEQADGPTYDFRDIAPQDNQDGGQPGGNIRVGFLFNPQRVTFVDRGEATATTATAVVEGPSGPELTLSPGRLDPANAAFTDSRKPLAAEFLFERQRLFLINNHFTSKTGSDSLFGRFHPPTNGGVEQREIQARVVHDFVAELFAIDAAARVMVLGDLNEFQFLTPLQILAGDPDPILTNLTATLPDEERYTFIFDGNAQSLDHLLVSDSLNSLAEVDLVHVNAEFAARVSDHDPTVARFTFPVRFATFNASLNRDSAGQLITDLSTPDNAQARVIAEIIQRAAPDVVLINEFDFDAAGTAAGLFVDNYLAVSQNGAAPIRYPFHYVAPSNTGLPCPPTVVCDFDHDGVADTTPGDATYANDALGFGFFPGQFGMIVYTKFPIADADVRTFQNFLWQEMPGALLPDDPATPASDDWYTAEELSVFPLSSKSHWDVPVRINGRPVHVLVSHPTPPVFDGEEGRNGRRNHDEIRLWADYINGGARAAYLVDDNGTAGGLAAGDSFVIMGDQNADPFDGDSVDGDSVDDAMLQLWHDPLINAEIDNGFTPASAGAEEQAALQGGANTTHTGHPAFDTADFADNAPGNLRVDYVLPSADLSIVGSAVFWPVSTDPLFDLVGTFPFPSSDHRLLWVDVVVPR